MVTKTQWRVIIADEPLRLHQLKGSSTGTKYSLMHLPGKRKNYLAIKTLLDQVLCLFMKKYIFNFLFGKDIIDEYLNFMLFTE